MQKTTGVLVITKPAVWMCVLGLLFYFYEYYLRVAPSVMSADLKSVFILGDAAFGHLSACYYYAYTPMQIPVGMMMDRFGPRIILTVACFLCALGTYLFAATDHVVIAQIGRFMVGFGSAFAYVGVLKLSNTWLPSKYFALVVGICTTLGMLGAISGKVIMARLVETVGWQSTLYYAALVGIPLMVALWFVLRDSRKSGKQDHKTLETTATVALGLFEIVKSPQMWINAVVGCFLFLPLTGFAEVWSDNYLETVGFSKSAAAWCSSMVFLGFALGGPLWGYLSDCIKSRRIPLVLGSFISAVFMFFAIWMPNTSVGWMYSVFFCTGFFASAQILIFAVANDLSRSAISATAAAFTNMVVMLGGMILPPLIGKVLDETVLLSGDALPTLKDYTWALTVLPVVLVLSGIFSFLLKETHHAANEKRPIICQSP